MKSSLVFAHNFPKAKDIGDEVLVIYDQILAKRSKDFQKWIQSFPLSYPVSAGEELKSVAAFPKHISSIVKICENASSRKLKVLAIGGGSVGDFAGFVASILKRGVGLVHMPSTWLAAIDSAHGGKTALNVGGAKNQIGTFYPAEKIFLVKKLLLAQPAVRSFEGFGELLKISIIQGGVLWKQLSQNREITHDVLWKHLKAAIEAKNRVVQKDPEEKSGHRHLLNLGHTVGHVFEADGQIPHGVAINYGLSFALQWSLEKKIMSQSVYNKMMSAAVMGYLLSPHRDQLISTSPSKIKKYRSLLLSDKKKTQTETVRFIFVKAPGQCVIQEVGVDDILNEMCRQAEEEDIDG
ncbi:3-dehydroquinate synthase [Bdellovibrio reynosensis]|uniref:3-dehydroquinate synthase n=1 Tax=Bdellovibrio reynosensis TaxID=2835041 RepID=A0ABY4C8G1_9BACT|nr:3-dehydroquinate synthase family protein [Bdellovibrio reynosensis]UOF00764.1 3-dehydroquinate synthase [Bdellovibrio reynosensis]